MAKVPNPAEDGSAFDEEAFYRRNPLLRQRKELMRAWRETLPPGEGPKPFRLLPWLGLGDREEDYPPPDRCTPEDGRLLYGKYFDLWKLGVPLDFQYPADFSPPPSFYEDEGACALAEPITNLRNGDPSREEKAAEYEQKAKKPLLKKARGLAIRLEATMDRLIAVEKLHPGYRSAYSSEPFMESPRLRDFSGIKNLARLAEQHLDRAGYLKKGRRGDRIKNELLKGFRGLGLGNKKIAEALKILGLEGAGDAADRVRQRSRRQK